MTRSFPQTPAHGPTIPRLGRFRIILALVAASALALPGSAGEWPQWHGDPSRSASSTEELSLPLHLQWMVELPTPSPAWPATQSRLQFDRLYEPILADGRLFVPSMMEDSLTAFNAVDGRELWRFHTDGPIRLAAAAWNGRVFFGSDDGFLYCLNAKDGSLLWKFQGGPSRRLLLGQGRLIHMWPVRGAPVIHEGAVYFAAGIWPFMGVFIHALDAETGKVIWTNSGTGSSYIVQQHDSPAFAGVAPQGYLAVRGDWLVVPGGRTVPAVLERKTGKLVQYSPASRSMGVKGGGGYEVLPGDDFYVNRGYLYRMGDGAYICPVSATIMTDNGMIGADDGSLRCYESKLSQEEGPKDRRGKPTVKTVVKTLWKADVGKKIETVFLKSGTRVFAKGEGRTILAIDLPREDRKAKITWSMQLPDDPLNVIAGGGRLFVSTDRGRIYCFGDEEPEPAINPQEGSFLVRSGDLWRCLDGGRDPSDGWERFDFDDGPWKEGPSQLGYGDGDEATEISFGNDKKRKAITSYFRRTFEVTGAWEGLTLRVLVDDGAVVYLNGAEVARFFMPSGAIRHDTLASETVETDEFQTVKLDPTDLRDGRNVLAVEVHQVNRTSSDVSFDLELVGRRSRPARFPELPHDSWTEFAASLLQASEARAGWAVVLGVGSGRLAQEIAARTELQVVVVEPESDVVDRYRRELDAQGIRRARVSVVTGDLDTIELPPYMAELVTSESMELGRILSDEPSRLEGIFRILRPYSGAIGLAATEEEHEALRESAAGLSLDHGVVERRAGFTWIRRLRAPEGSAPWTHQYADSGNTVASADRQVRLPLGLLWFGGPSHEGVLPRHGHGPGPQVTGGRLFIEGRDMIRAVDVYTGRLLWQRELKDVGKDYDNTDHEPGANAIGANYVSLDDGVYVIHEGGCVRLDPSSGETLSEYALPAAPDDTEPPKWSAIEAWGDLLIAGGRPIEFVETDFTEREFSSIDVATTQKLAIAIAAWKDFQPIREEEASDLRELVRANVNKLLADAEMVAKIPEDVRKEAKTEELERRLAELDASSPSGNVRALEARKLRREILARCYKLPAFREEPAGRYGSLLGIYSQRVYGVERLTGNALWSFQAKHQIRHNTIAVGGGKVFLIDGLSTAQLDFLRRRGMTPQTPSRIVALDAHSGDISWIRDEGVFGTWLSYSQEYDVLFEGGSSSRDRLLDEVGKGMRALRGATGAVLWKNDESYGGPCMILGRRMITQAQGSGGFALDLLTGQIREREHPISGEPVVWQYSRNYGCNTALASVHLLTFRSAAAGYYDLTGDGGTGNFGGFRSGCTANLIAADGVLSAPDYTRTCTCAYQNQTSLAFVHMPDVEIWTFQNLPPIEAPTQRVGLNFSAPGDRVADDGTLWIDYPSVGGSSPDLPISVEMESPRRPRYHASRILGGDLPWVASSALVGEGQITVGLVPKSKATQKEAEAPVASPDVRIYSVTLVFAEIEDAPAGNRVFDVSIQDLPVLTDFDVARAAGGPRRTVIRTFEDVRASDTLKIALRSRQGLPPLLCGLRIEAASPAAASHPTSNP